MTTSIFVHKHSEQAESEYHLLVFFVVPSCGMNDPTSEDFGFSQKDVS
jgi:hypothetical protein